MKAFLLTDMLVVSGYVFTPEYYCANLFVKMCVFLIMHKCLDMKHLIGDIYLIS